MDQIIVPAWPRNASALADYVPSPEVSGLLLAGLLLVVGIDSGAAEPSVALSVLSVSADADVAIVDVEVGPNGDVTALVENRFAVPVAELRVLLHYEWPERNEHSATSHDAYRAASVLTTISDRMAPGARLRIGLAPQPRSAAPDGRYVMHTIVVGYMPLAN